MRQAASECALDWRQRFIDFRTSIYRSDFEQARGAFLWMCDDFASHIKQHQPEAMMQLRGCRSKEEGVELIRTPFLGSLWPQRFDPSVMSQN
jgi:hypothetical protein